jgi:RNA polymerase subunit RPABC4/transcription elongation factor Spt4
MSDEKINFSDEVKEVPWWAIGLAAVAFIGIQVLMHTLGFRHEHNPPPVAFQLFLGLLIGSLAAFWMMLIGYVNRDAKRRGMRSGLWTAIAIFVPNGIGIILYFVLRQPLSSACPQCGATVSGRFNFCPNCKYNLRPACPECKREVRPGDRYCPYCAHDFGAEGPTGWRPVTPSTPAATA